MRSAVNQLLLELDDVAASNDGLFLLEAAITEVKASLGSWF
jgi:hypothetical protein